MKGAAQTVEPGNAARAAHGKGPGYVLGHDSRELERLSLQGRLLAPALRHGLHAAGIRPGMRIIEVGCGSGDVTVELATLAGPEGHVVAIDRSPDAVETARKRAASSGCSNVEFVEGDALQINPDAGFDAAVGRLILLYLPDPALLVRRLAGVVRSGGVLFFQEFDIGAARSFPETPEASRAFRWVRAAFERSGADLFMASRLYRTFLRAGMAAPSLLQEGLVAVPPDSASFQVLAELVRSLSPALIGFGIATPEELQLDTLAHRLQEDAHAAEATLWWPPMLAAWGTVNGA